LEVEAAEAGQLSYIGATAIAARLRDKQVNPLPSSASIERVVRAAGLSHPRPAKVKPEVSYPHLEPTQAQQLVQVDIVPHFLPGGAKAACFNAVDVVSHYPTGQQSGQRRADDALAFLTHLWQTLGIPDYTQVDNESCFSGGFTHPGVLGQVVRLALWVGTELVFSPLYHPQSNGTVERFHQDYNQFVWQKFELADLAAVQRHSPAFFEAYRYSQHIQALHGHSPAQVHFAVPYRLLPADFDRPDPLPLTAGRVHFMRLVQPSHQITLLNLSWAVTKAQPGQGVWATLTLAPRQSTLRIFDAAPDAPQRICWVQHPFPLKEPVLPLPEHFQKPIPVEPSWFSLGTDLFRSTLKLSWSAWISTMS
jgi:hypothetical protein